MSRLSKFLYSLCWILVLTGVLTLIALVVFDDPARAHPEPGDCYPLVVIEENLLKDGFAKRYHSLAGNGSNKTTVWLHEDGRNIFVVSFPASPVGCYLAGGGAWIEEPAPVPGAPS